MLRLKSVCRSLTDIPSDVFVAGVLAKVIANTIAAEILEAQTSVSEKDNTQ